MAEKPNTHVAVLYTHKTDGPQIDRVHRALAAAYAASLEEETFVRNGSTKIVEIKMADRERLANLV